MKLFVYHVGGVDYPDTIPFGPAWKMAKSKADELGYPIFRTIIEERREAYCKGGIFLGNYYDEILYNGKEN